MRQHVWLVAVLVGCASSGPAQDEAHTATVKSTIAPQYSIDLTRETVVKETQIAAPRAQVLDALVAVHEALKIPFTGGTRESGYATFEATNRIRSVAGKPASRYIDCGQGPAGARVDSYRLTVKLTHALQNDGASGTMLQTSLEAWARNPALSGEPVLCRSLGVLEKEIGGIVMARVQ